MAAHDRDSLVPLLRGEITTWARRYQRAVEGGQPFTAEYVRGAVAALVHAAARAGAGSYGELRAEADRLMLEPRGQAAGLPGQR